MYEKKSVEESVSHLTLRTFHEFLEFDHPNGIQVRSYLDPLHLQSSADALESSADAIFFRNRSCGMNLSDSNL